MTRRLIVRLEAESDLVQARRWYEKQRRGLGLEFLDAVGAMFERIERNPEAYTQIRDKLRRALVRQFPFGVFYLLERERIVVVAVLRASRDPRPLEAACESWPLTKAQGIRRSAARIRRDRSCGTTLV